MPDDTDRYEVVVKPSDALEKEHAELIRKQLLNDGFHDHVVSVRPVDGEKD